LFDKEQYDDKREDDHDPAGGHFRLDGSENPIQTCSSDEKPQNGIQKGSDAGFVLISRVYRRLDPITDTIEHNKLRRSA
jgi:hypothetical protein